AFAADAGCDRDGALIAAGRLHFGRDEARVVGGGIRRDHPADDVFGQGFAVGVRRVLGDGHLAGLDGGFEVVRADVLETRDVYEGKGHRQTRHRPAFVVQDLKADPLWINESRTARLLGAGGGADLHRSRLLEFVETFDFAAA